MNKIANAAIANVRHGDASDDVIRIEGIEFSWSKRGPHTLVIDDFRVARGERVFVHGPSGSGKTTLLSLLGGVVVAQKGKIDVLDERLDRMRSARRDQFRADNIGFIFQMFNLIPYLSLVDNVLLPCRFSTKRTQRALVGTASDNVAEEAARLLELLGLDTSLLYRRATALSVGQQQRVAAARALIGRPPLLIADEPTSALDADTRHVFIELLFSQCAKAGTTIIFVSHDKSLAPRFDRQVSIAEINTASQGK